jgi:hypothetical protein
MTSAILMSRIMNYKNQSGGLITCVRSRVTVQYTIYVATCVPHVPPSQLKTFKRRRKKIVKFLMISACTRLQPSCRARSTTPRRDRRQGNNGRGYNVILERHGEVTTSLPAHTSCSDAPDGYIVLGGLQIMQRARLQFLFRTNTETIKFSNLEDYRWACKTY